MLKEITCIGCPMGCRITAELDEDGRILSVDGYTCNVGRKYAQEELTAPKRVVTALMNVWESRQPLSVKTSQAIEKSKIPDCLREIRSRTATLPVHTGEVLIRNVCGTSADIVATKDMY